MKKIQIEQCHQGYMVTDLIASQKHAVTKDSLVRKVKELLGITDKSKAMAEANPFPFISDGLDSTFPMMNSAMTGDVKPESPATEINSQSKIETKLSPGSSFVFSEISVFEVSVQPVTIGKAILWLHPSRKKIRISRVNYSTMIYANISDLVYLYDHQADAIKIIQDYGKATYGNKAVILRGFMKDVPLSALVTTAYHEDAIIEKKEEPNGEEDGTCDEDTFESCINGFTAKDEKTAKGNCKFCVDKSRYENKLAAKKPAPPSKKASAQS